MADDEPAALVPPEPLPVDMRKRRVTKEENENDSSRNANDKTQATISPPQKSNKPPLAKYKE